MNTLQTCKIAIAILTAHLRITEVDLHDEGDCDPCGKGQASSDDDGEAVTLAGAVVGQGVAVGLPQRREIMADQIRCRGGESLQTSRPQEEVWIWSKRYIKFMEILLCSIIFWLWTWLLKMSHYQIQL